LGRGGARPRRIVAGVCLAALFPLALGSAVVSRYDLWPAVLVAAALAALVSGWERSAAGLLGLAAAAKVYPVALVALGAAYVWKRSGRRAALVWLVVFGGIVPACLVPFVVLAPGGVWASVSGLTIRAQL